MNHILPLVLCCLFVNTLGELHLQGPTGYFRKLPGYDKTNDRIVGGSIAEEGAFPYQVSLQIYESHFCGGSILNQQWILTAAHCARSYRSSKYLDSIEVVVGTNSLTKGGMKYGLKRFIVYPEYNMIGAINDIALIEINGRILFSSSVSAIPLPSYDVNKANEPAVVTGWGSTALDEESPSELYFLNTKIYDHEACLKFNLSEYKVSEKNICTLTEEGEGLCYGDSGGPVVSHGVQVGIVSWGSPCAKGQPDIHTRVFSFVDWINSHINKE